MEIRSKKYIILALCICLAFACAVIHAFQYLPDKSFVKRLSPTVNLPSDDTSETQNDNKQEEAQENNIQEDEKDVTDTLEEVPKNEIENLSETLDKTIDVDTTNSAITSFQQDIDSEKAENISEYKAN